MARPRVIIPTRPIYIIPMSKSWESGDNVFGGAGFEYFPLKEDKDIRLHAAWSYNENMSGHTFDIGLTWKMNLTKALKSIF